MRSAHQQGFNETVSYNDWKDRHELVEFDASLDAKMKNASKAFRSPCWDAGMDGCKNDMDFRSVLLFHRALQHVFFELAEIDYLKSGDCLFYIQGTYRVKNNPDDAAINHLIQRFCFVGKQFLKPRLSILVRAEPLWSKCPEGEYDMPMHIRPSDMPLTFCDDLIGDCIKDAFPEVLRIVQPDDGWVFLTSLDLVMWIMRSIKQGYTSFIVHRLVHSPIHSANFVKIHTGDGADRTKTLWPWPGTSSKKGKDLLADVAAMYAGQSLLDPLLAVDGIYDFFGDEASSVVDLCQDADVEEAAMFGLDLSAEHQEMEAVEEMQLAHKRKRKAMSEQCIAELIPIGKRGAFLAVSINGTHRGMISYMMQWRPVSTSVKCYWHTDCTITADIDHDVTALTDWIVWGPLYDDASAHKSNRPAGTRFRHLALHLRR
jgi:hypothetical protein